MSVSVSTTVLLVRRIPANSAPIDNLKASALISRRGNPTLAGRWPKKYPQSQIVCFDAHGAKRFLEFSWVFNCSLAFSSKIFSTVLSDSGRQIVQALLSRGLKSGAGHTIVVCRQRRKAPLRAEWFQMFLGGYDV